jgi:hypothetical protein
MKALFGVVAALILVSAASGQTPMPAPKMTPAEGLQVLEAGGFKFVGGKAINVCGTASTPKFTYLDLNGDGAPEAVAVDKNPSCYGGTGDWFTVIAKGRNGRWQGIARDSGTIGWEATRTAGWLDARVTSNCPRIWKWAGDGYIRRERPVRGLHRARGRPRPQWRRQAGDRGHRLGDLLLRQYRPRLLPDGKDPGRRLALGLFQPGHATVPGDHGRWRLA